MSELALLRGCTESNVPCFVGGLSSITVRLPLLPTHGNISASPEGHRKGWGMLGWRGEIRAWTLEAGKPGHEPVMFMMNLPAV